MKCFNCEQYIQYNKDLCCSKCSTFYCMGCCYHINMKDSRPIEEQKTSKYIFEYFDKHSEDIINCSACRGELYSTETILEFLLERVNLSREDVCKKLQLINLLE